MDRDFVNLQSTNINLAAIFSVTSETKCVRTCKEKRKLTASNKR